MDERLGSLARFERIESARIAERLVIDNSWFQVDDDTLPVAVEYYRGDGGLVTLRGDDGEDRYPVVELTGAEFLAIVAYLVRRGLLEDVGLVSTETAPTVPVETHSCLCTVEPARVGARHASPVQEDGAEDDDEIEMDWPRYFRERELTETSPVQEEEGEEAENEGEPNAPFALPIVELVEGDGDPEWLTDPRVMVYLHHQLELSVTDMARVCDTTYARVKGALKRLGIEQRSYRGGRSKIGPRRDSGSTGR